MKINTRKTSAVLKDIVDELAQGDTISVGDFLKMLGEKAFFFAVLVFSLPNSLPVPGIPGFSTLTGIPITFIGMQMMLGRHSLWLPHKISDKTFSAKSVSKMLSKALPMVIWLEKFLTPRWLYMSTPLAIRAMGGMFVVLSLIIALPIPGGNFLPGLSMSLLVLGMIERDGLFVTAALAFAVGGIVFMYNVILLFFAMVADAFRSLF